MSEFWTSNSDESWKAAKEWEDKQNENSDEWQMPKWSFDCSFKLDFDGTLIGLSSRFYPPCKKYGEKWDGTINICYGDYTMKQINIECETLDDLRFEVTSKVEEIKDKLITFVESLD